MNNPTTHKTGHGDCCTDKCESGLRNNYFQGKRMTLDSFRLEQDYLLERRRMLNRSIYGWGVVNGYAIKEGPPKKSTGPRSLRIGPGLALDSCGRELLHTERFVGLDELIDENGNPFNPEDASAENHNDSSELWLLSVHYAEKRTGRVKIKDSCECEWDEWDHTCETVVFSLRRTTKEECCEDFECELKCKCRGGGCCDESLDRRDVDKEDYTQSVEVREGNYGDKYEQGDHGHEGSSNEKDRRRKGTLLKRGGCRCQSSAP